MSYYKLALLKRKLEPLTYLSEEVLPLGLLVDVIFQGKSTQAVVIEATQKPNFTCKEIENKTQLYFNEYQLKLAQFIATYYVSDLGKALGLFTPFTRGNQPDFKDFTLKNHLTLSSKQKSIKKTILQKEQVLLFGDTGSGKSEIYMSIMEDVLAKKQNIIFLMPEISLTPQMKKRLTQYFGDLVAIWHSKITKKQKNSILEDIKRGKVRIIAGARSALFLPLPDIGLIIVDEEHDDSYKSANSPRYNAKDLSLMYGKILQAKVILGSATPSLTSHFKLPIARLKETYFQTQKTFIYENANNEITPFLLETIAQTLEQNNQSIVFVPTRANFKYLTCKECGANIECPYCSISMSLHKNHNILRCHYCNFSTKIPQTCHVCGSSMIESRRIGTMEVADTLKTYFKNSSIEVFDKDTVTTTRKLNSILKAFNEKKIDILVGTQMLSKGHDYHNVALSVILGLDANLAIPDFRSLEKTLSLALQISGRSGRKGVGKVFIQTKNREFFEKYIENYDIFLQDELSCRHNLYPPYKKLLRLLITHKKESVCEEITQKAIQTIQSLNFSAQIIGYGKANIAKIANKYRYHILLRSNSAKVLLQIAFLCKKMQYIEADMDPLSFS